jgi:hypothetical protein
MSPLGINEVTLVGNDSSHTTMVLATHQHQVFIRGLTKVGAYFDRDWTLVGIVRSTRERSWVCCSIASDP